MSHLLMGKHIIVGVSAGIAAYKSIELVSRLRKAGAQVKVVMTKNATHIASPLTFGEISGHPVALDMWEQVHDWNVEHISLATWADAYVIAPASANVIGKIANGIADDMLTTTVMATPSPKFLCPAMNSEMYNNPIVQRNLHTLKHDGYHIMQPGSGWLACGVVGVGRLPEPEEIVSWLNEQFQYEPSLNFEGSTEGRPMVSYANGTVSADSGNSLISNVPVDSSFALSLTGKIVIVTAGGTQENIDPVRYIGNRSSGKMGYAIAEQAVRAGAHVILVSAPTNLKVPEGVDFVLVDSARSMQQAVDSRFDSADAVVMAAAVADFRVVNMANQKIKKMETMTLELVKNPDILYGLGQKKSHQVLIGFAAETERVVEYGMGKVHKKNLDMLVANDVSKSTAGFNVDTNEGYFLFPNQDAKEIPNMSKQEMAKAIVEELATLIQSK